MRALRGASGTAGSLLLTSVSQESAAGALASVRAIAAREEASAAQADGAFAADLAQVYRRKLAGLRGR